MKLNLSTLKVGDIIQVDCGYNGMIDMEDVTVVAIGQSIDLWDKALSRPYVVVKDRVGAQFSLNVDLFA